MLDGDVESVSGTLVADYVFDKTWQLKNISTKDSLKVEIKADKALDANMDRVIGDIQKPEIKYGVSGAIQKVTISKDQIEDFTVNSQNARSKGTEQSIQCSAKLIKGHVTFNVSINAEYIFEDGTWNCSQIEPELTFASADLQGEWRGTYRKAAEMELSILILQKWMAIILRESIVIHHMDRANGMNPEVIKWKVNLSKMD